MKILLEGHSHQECIRMRGWLPPGIPLGIETAQAWLALRRPGQGTGASARREPDALIIESGIEHGRTTDQPLVLRLDNVDVRSQDYPDLHRTPRPGHGDYAWHMHDENASLAGGARSGRMTALHVALAGLLDDWLQSQGVISAAGLIGAGDLLHPFHGSAQQLRRVVADSPTRGVSEQLALPIEAARANRDSVGGLVHFQIDGMTPGIGGSWGTDIPSRLASWLWQIPGVKGMELGSGMNASTLRGSIHNDPLRWQEGVQFTKNDAGGVLGGRATGQPIVGRIAFKPTPSIAQPQASVDLVDQKNVDIAITGRHDACIAVRGTMVVQAMCNLAITETLLASH